MKNTLFLIVLSMASVSNLYAENRLFPTDILSKGEADVHFSVSRNTRSANFTFQGESGTASSVRIAESAQVRYGVGSNLHVGAAMSYLSRAVIDEDFGNPPARHSDRTAEGRQNPTIFATYGFINDKTSPLSLIGELAATTNTTGKEHSVYTGSVVAGWKTSNTLRLYSGFSTSMSTDSGRPTFNSVNIGAYKALSDSLTLIPHAGYGRFNSTDTFSAVTSLNTGLAGIIRLAPNSYLNPAINFYKNGSADRKDGLFHQNKTGNNRTLSVGFYHLF